MTTDLDIRPPLAGTITTDRWAFEALGRILHLNTVAFLTAAVRVLHRRTARETAS